MIVPEEFYPTPDHVISRMVEPYKDKIQEFTILDPSAGSGAILDYVHQKMNHYSYKRAQLSRIYAIEIDPNLTFILQGKGYKVISDDFLKYNGRHSFDLILMNPPFSNGDQHLLRAWELLDSGNICCLLNAETIKNPYTRQRQLLADIIKANGETEFMGKCFQSADRRTDVDVMMVRLRKEANSGKHFNFDFGHQAPKDHLEFPDEITSTEVAKNDIIGSFISAYDESIDAYLQYQKAYTKLRTIMDSYLEDRLVTSIIKSADEQFNMRSRYNHFMDESRQHAWKHILSKLKVQKFITNSVYKDFNKFVSAQGCMELNKDNIRKLIDFIFDNQHSIMDKAIEDVFDLFTKYHEYNRCHIEGWKTNSAWRVNKKVILPHFLELSYSGCYNSNHRYWDQYQDIDKVMCYLTGKDFNNIESLQSAVKKVKIGNSNQHASEFFYFRCYKKQTLHIVFKDDWLWAEFNQRACKSKNWLPGT
jgi:hypothetical protein